jgi:hypothetical protein
MIATIAVSSLALTLTFAAGVVAQSPRPDAAKETTKKADEVIKGFTVPESPAFVFLSASPAKVTKPTTAREFAAALVSGIDENGKVRQGTAMEFLPSIVFKGIVKPTGLLGYQARTFKYWWSNLQASLGTVRTSGDSTSTDLAFGVRLPILDRGDPMADRRVSDALVGAMIRCASQKPPGVPIPPVDPPAKPDVQLQPPDTTIAGRLRRLEAVDSARRSRERSDQETKCLADAIAAIGKSYRENGWTAAVLTVAWAHGVRLAGASPGDRSNLGDRAWVIGGIPIVPGRIQLLGYLEHANVLLKGDSTKTKLRTFGGRLVGGRANLNGFFEVLGSTRVSGGGTTPKTTTQWSGGGEIKLTSELWLGVGFGKDERVSKSSGPNVVLANLKWGISDKARFGHD